MNKLKINYFSLSCILLVLFILLNDYFCFIFHINFNILLYLLSGIITFFVFYFIKDKIEIVKPKYDKLDIIFYIILAMILIAKIAVPDMAFDTLNYHLYLQERLFSNNATFNFFPARWINTYSFPLADRIHFFFRNIFGYRLGIIANILFMIVIYYQVKEILSYFVKDKKMIPYISAFILITEQLLSNMVTYYVDLLAIPFILEIIIIILNNKKVNNLTSYIVLFLSGIIISMKISNAFLLIPLAIIYIIKYRKDINWKTIVFGLLIAVFPLLVYSINNYLQTGNPVFPFYNSIFHSKYLLDENWIETFYGPKSFKERLLWPLYIIRYPRRSYDSYYYYGRISFGYLIALIYLLLDLYKMIFKKEKLNNISKFNILFILLCLIWSNFMMGYIRYALVLEVLSGIIMVIVANEVLKDKKWYAIPICIISISGFIYTSSCAMGDMLNTSVEFSWRRPINIVKMNENDINNVKNIFSRNSNYNKYIENIDCLGIVDYNSGYAALLSDEKPIIGINESYISEYGEKEFNKIANKCKNIYTISTDATYDRTINYMEQVGYEKVGDNISFNTSFIDANNKIILFEIKKS